MCTDTGTTKTSTDPLLFTTLVQHDAKEVPSLTDLD